MPPTARKLASGPSTGVTTDHPLVVTRDGSVALLTIDRPAKRNAMTAAMWAELPLPTDDERRVLAAGYVELFRELHRHDVVLGDVSMRNLLWTLSGGPGVFAIDCDGFRVAGRPPAVQPADTAGWVDPAGPREITLDTDRYKLALLTLRVLLANHRVTPEDVRGSQAVIAAYLGSETHHGEHSPDARSDGHAQEGTQ